MITVVRCGNSRANTCFQVQLRLPSPPPRRSRSPRRRRSSRSRCPPGTPASGQKPAEARSKGRGLVGPHEDQRVGVKTSQNMLKPPKTYQHLHRTPMKPFISPPTSTPKRSTPGRPLQDLVAGLHAVRPAVLQEAPLRGPLRAEQHRRPGHLLAILVHLQQL